VALGARGAGAVIVSSFGANALVARVFALTVMSPRSPSLNSPIA
jgi:hypothetical protein